VNGRSGEEEAERRLMESEYSVYEGSGGGYGGGAEERQLLLADRGRSWVVKIHFFLKKKVRTGAQDRASSISDGASPKNWYSTWWCTRRIFRENLRMSMLGYFWTYIYPLSTIPKKKYLLSTYYQTSLIKLMYKPS
jgi:hypothetical protein